MIVPMKKLDLIGLNNDRDKLLADLMRLSCVQIEDQTAFLTDERYQGLLERVGSKTTDIKSAQQTLKQALDTLIKYAHPKTSIFTPRPALTEKELMDGSALQSARVVSDAIMAAQREIAALNTEEGRVQNRYSALLPWRNFQMPLSVSSTENCIIQLGVCPASSDMEELKRLLTENAPLSSLDVISGDREQFYLLFVCHRSQENESSELLKSFGFSRTHFKDVEVTAEKACSDCQKRITEIQRQRESLENDICSHVDDRGILERAIDALGVYLSRSEASERALSTGACFQITAWLEAPRQPSLERVLRRYDCAWELAEPDRNDEERPPVRLKNNKLLEPFNMVTDMYSLPDYYNIDPNPLISFFFALFFGIMYADLGYGLVLVALGVWVSTKLRLRGILGQMFRLMIIVGASSAIMGVITGGFFSDSLTVIGETFFGTSDWGIRALFDPMSDPLSMLIICMVIGAVQLIFGMCVKAYILIRDGKPWDALMDVGSWWLVFAGIAVLAMGGTHWIAVAGAAALVLTQGRSAKSIGGKLAGGLGSLYDITAYMSDVLSYARLMALCMAGAVIGSVFNMLAGMVAGGAGFIIGAVLFIVIFVAGHAFNMAINIIGTYVHAARLQYLEFFGKFYEGGGKRFKPLTIETKYVDILKEANES